MAHLVVNHALVLLKNIMLNKAHLVDASHSSAFSSSPLNRSVQLSEKENFWLCRQAWFHNIRVNAIDCFIDCAANNQCFFRFREASSRTGMRTAARNLVFAKLRRAVVIHYNPRSR